MSTLAEILAKKKEALNSTSIVPVLQEAIKEEKKKLSLSELLALKKRDQEAAALALEPEQHLGSEYQPSALSIIADLDADAQGPIHKTSETFSLDIVLNEKQLMSCEYTLAGKSHCLIGAAGTGKTTAQRAVAAELLKSSKLVDTTFKVQGQAGMRVPAPSIAFVAYTRRASGNLARAIHKDPVLEKKLHYNIMTIHALLEYEPESYFTEEGKESMRFIPRRDAGHPLDITHLVIEEASMLGLDLWENLLNALRPGIQIIFIGDINQLPPVFGSSILNYALVQLPVVELTQVYRQAEDSPIIHNAHRILKGLPVEEAEKFKIVRGKSPVQVGQSKMATVLGTLFKTWDAEGFYDPEQDIILSPFNKQDLGTDNMNKWIAQFQGEKRKADVYEIVAGFNKLYLAVGDKVMFNKQDGIITNIRMNGMYHGQLAQPHGVDLTRFGVRKIGADNPHGITIDLDELALGYETFSVEELAAMDEGRKQQASHTVEVQLETGDIKVLSSAGDFAPQTFSLGYVLTVHKAQGCEWRKVFIILHKEHRIMLSRELLYTAVTRAREECILIAKDEVINKAIQSPRLKGNTLEEKIMYFNSGALENGFVQCTK